MEPGQRFSAPRSLKRAANLLTSNGQPAVDDLGTAKQSSEVSQWKRGRLKLTKSLKRTASNVKSLALSRTRSWSDPSPDLAPVRSRHARATSLQLPRTPLRTQTEPLPRVAEAASPLTESPLASNKEPVINASVPLLLQEGIPMTKVSTKARKKIILRLNADQGHITWDSKSQKIIPIESIKDIRSRSDARYYREQFQLAQECEDRWITLSYILDGDYKILHLIAGTREVLRQLETALRQLHSIRRSLMTGLGDPTLRQALWERQYWTSSDQEKDEKLAFEEVEKLCKRLNISSSTEDLSRIFKQADKKDRNYLDFEDFRSFVKLLKARSEVDRLYKKLRAANNNVFDFHAFEKFMRDKQGSTLDDARLRSIFNAYSSKDEASPMPSTKPSTDKGEINGHETFVMTTDSFTSFLMSTDNSAFSDRHTSVWQDMSRPMSEYYISSSHNTYLVGHQLVGDSTIEGYIRALLHSCRSVEIDIYDGAPPLSEPMIFHGKTLTSKVSLREVCEAIKKYGFVSSPYPIVVSAEVHCGIAQQDLIALIMSEVFGDALVKSNPEDRPQISNLPSPEDLKGKILLKTKNLFLSHSRQDDADKILSDASTSSASDSDTVQSPDVGKSARRESDSLAVREQAKSLLRRVSNRRRSSAHGSISSSPPELGLAPVTSRDADRPPMSSHLASLLVYTVGVKCRGINKKEEYAPEHMFSLSEKSAKKMVKTAMFDLIKHCRTHLVRIYPKGMRLSSTNYEPHRYWAAGCQLVAINWQTFDLGFTINHAMFQRNGRAGYVLKPSALRMNDKEALIRRTKHILDLTIISAQQLPRPKDSLGREIIDKFVFNPYVEVSVHVPDWNNLTTYSLNGSAGQPPNSSSATRTFSYRTSVVKNNGFNPVWEERLRIPFECVGDMMDLIFVRFIVRQEDKDDLEPLATYCVSLGSLQRGYRHLPLHDSQLSQYLFSTLFVRTILRDA